MVNPESEANFFNQAAVEQAADQQEEEQPSASAPETSIDETASVRTPEQALAEELNDTESVETSREGEPPSRAEKIEGACEVVREQFDQYLQEEKRDLSVVHA